MNICAEQVFNIAGTHLPIHVVRLWMLRRLGVTLGKQCVIFRGTTVIGARQLRIGERCNIGFRCMLDARAGVELGDDVVLASDVHIITAQHDLAAPDFGAKFAPVVIERYVWLASRSTVLMGARMGYGSVAAAGAVVVDDVPALTVVGGVPARPIASRVGELSYQNTSHPPLY